MRPTSSARSRRAGGTRRRARRTIASPSSSTATVVTSTSSAAPSPPSRRDRQLADRIGVESARQVVDEVLEPARRRRFARGARRSPASCRTARSSRAPPRRTCSPDRPPVGPSSSTIPPNTNVRATATTSVAVARLHRSRSRSTPTTGSRARPNNTPSRSGVSTVCDVRTSARIAIASNTPPAINAVVITSTRTIAGESATSRRSVTARYSTADGRRRREQVERVAVRPSTLDPSALTRGGMARAGRDYLRHPSRGGGAQRRGVVRRWCSAGRSPRSWRRCLLSPLVSVARSCAAAGAGAFIIVFLAVAAIGVGVRSLYVTQLQDQVDFLAEHAPGHRVGDRGSRRSGR